VPGAEGLPAGDEQAVSSDTACFMETDKSEFDIGLCPASSSDDMAPPPRGDKNEREDGEQTIDSDRTQLLLNGKEINNDSSPSSHVVQRYVCTFVIMLSVFAVS
jgi:hypothetical protein